MFGILSFNHRLTKHFSRIACVSCFVTIFKATVMLYCTQVGFLWLVFSHRLTCGHHTKSMLSSTLTNMYRTVLRQTYNPIGP